MDEGEAPLPLVASGSAVNGEDERAPREPVPTSGGHRVDQPGGLAPPRSGEEGSRGERGTALTDAATSTSGRDDNGPSGSNDNGASVSNSDGGGAEFARGCGGTGRRLGRPPGRGRGRTRDRIARIRAQQRAAAESQRRRRALETEEEKAERLTAERARSAACRQRTREIEGEDEKEKAARKRQYGGVRGRGGRKKAEPRGALPGGPVFESGSLEPPSALESQEAQRCTEAPRHFTNAAGDGVSVRCSYEADDGQLYPLDRGFFYVHKPPLLIPDNDIESVEFARQGSGAVSSSVRTFDLVIRLKGGAEHMFRNIQCSEWGNLFEFINTKKVPIVNLASAKRGPGGAVLGLDADDHMDPGMRRAAAEADDDEDDEDEDFDAAGGTESSESIDEDDDAEMIEEEGVFVEASNTKTKRGRTEGGEAGAEKPAKKPKKEKTTPTKREGEAGGDPPGGSGGKAKGKGRGKKGGAEGEEGAAPAKKERKKKDPNAPKKNLSAFMYFSNTSSDKVKQENPGIAFGEVGKLLGERWKAMGAEEKAPFEEMAAKDKVRYAEAMKAYKDKVAGAGREAEEDGEEAGEADDE
ncbi:hypothetical protein HYH03_013812 [Edaphochlamys debaryana]|uniref:FACT complex subunit SSRP1 n=1 Tax=Edaphochlamys debaryana TaxID=47281 RepID=A0A835XME3_9CHLO|nr:hypothetical protein HYH03_013812 [Edaphochlamys debaryana]|eukprot:KAG2487532.1 hypothetical protein HYH03_013812 [Edaphochlamys debaryana]